MATDQWRKEIKPEEVYRSFSVPQLETSKAYYPRWTGRRDRLGRPVYVYKIGAITKEQQKELFSRDEHERYKTMCVKSRPLSMMTEC